jgi:hypothetical protein
MSQFVDVSTEDRVVVDEQKTPPKEANRDEIIAIAHSQTAN